MAKVVSRIRDFFAKDPLSAHLVTLAACLNFWAWIIPRGDYRSPVRDPLGAAAWISEMIGSVSQLYYFWNTLLAFTVFAIGYSAYRVWTIGLSTIADRVDL